MVEVMVEERVIPIPEDVEVQLDNRKVTVKGPLGKLEKDFSSVPIQISHTDDGIQVRSYWAGKIERALVGTIASHVKNMIKGVTKGYTYKLKKVYSHFPINVKLDGDKIIIENFIGERSSRVAKVVGNVKISIKGDDIEIYGLDVEEVSQTAANIEQSTKIKKKDLRIFLDGIYVYEKSLEG